MKSHHLAAPETVLRDGILRGLEKLIAGIERQRQWDLRHHVTDGVHEPKVLRPKRPDQQVRC